MRATIAVSALGRAMKELNKVAIVRCVWRQGQGNVVLGVLTPNLSENDKIVGFSMKKYFGSLHQIVCLCVLCFVSMDTCQYCLLVF